MTTVLNDVGARRAPSFRPYGHGEVRVALLGLGHVGSAVAAAAARAHSGIRFTITTALVRDVRRPRVVDTSRFTLTTDPSEPLASDPDVVVEVLDCELVDTLQLEARRAVDDHVDARPLREHPLDDCTGRLGSGKIGRHSERVPAGLGDRRGDVVQPFAPPADERHLEPSLRQVPSRGFADSGAGSRDDGDSTLELEPLEERHA